MVDPMPSSSSSGFQRLDFDKLYSNYGKFEFETKLIDAAMEKKKIEFSGNRWKIEGNEIEINQANPPKVGILTKLKAIILKHDPFHKENLVQQAVNSVKAIQEYHLTYSTSKQQADAIANKIVERTEQLSKYFEIQDTIKKTQSKIDGISIKLKSSAEEVQNLGKEKSILNNDLSALSKSKNDLDKALTEFHSIVSNLKEKTKPTKILWLITIKATPPSKEELQQFSNAKQKLMGFITKYEKSSGEVSDDELFSQGKAESGNFQQKITELNTRLDSVEKGIREKTDSYSELLTKSNPELQELNDKLFSLNEELKKYEVPISGSEESLKPPSTPSAIPAPTPSNEIGGKYKELREILKVLKPDHQRLQEELESLEKRGLSRPSTPSVEPGDSIAAATPNIERIYESGRHAGMLAPLFTNLFKPDNEKLIKSVFSETKEGVTELTIQLTEPMLFLMPTGWDENDKQKVDGYSIVLIGEKDSNGNCQMKCKLSNNVISDIEGMRGYLDTKVPLVRYSYGKVQKIIFDPQQDIFTSDIVGRIFSKDVLMPVENSIEDQTRIWQNLVPLLPTIKDEKDYKALLEGKIDTKGNPVKKK